MEPTQVTAGKNAQVAIWRWQALPRKGTSQTPSPGNVRARAHARPGARPRRRPGPPQRWAGGGRGGGARTRGGGAGGADVQTLAPLRAGDV